MGATLPSETSAALKEASKAMQSDQLKSKKRRLGQHEKMNGIMNSKAFDATEVKAPVFVDVDLVLPSCWRERLARNGTFQTRDHHKAGVFIVGNPFDWSASKLCVWAAILSGGWLTTATSYLGETRGPAVKFHSALMTERVVWVSAAFRTACPRIWGIILESMIAVAGRWKLLHSPIDWASAKARHERNGASSRALALVTDADAVPNTGNHIFNATQFLR